MPGLDNNKSEWHSPRKKRKLRTNVKNRTPLMKTPPSLAAN
jgi:hypothetical protein